MEITYDAWTLREVDRGIFGSVVLQHLRNDSPQNNENSVEIMRRGGYRNEHFRWSRSTSAITTGVTGLSYRIGAIPWDRLVSARKNYRDPLDRIYLPAPVSFIVVCRFVPNQIPRLPITRDFDLQCWSMLRRTSLVQWTTKRELWSSDWRTWTGCFRGWRDRTNGCEVCRTRCPGLDECSTLCEQEGNVSTRSVHICYRDRVRDVDDESLSHIRYCFGIRLSPWKVSCFKGTDTLRFERIWTCCTDTQNANTISFITWFITCSADNWNMMK